MSDYAQELLDRDKSLRKASNELYMVVTGEYEDRNEVGAFELKADAVKCRDKLNETITYRADRARLDVIRFYPRGTYNGE